jgi:hypothetical protein
MLFDAAIAGLQTPYWSTVRQFTQFSMDSLGIHSFFALGKFKPIGRRQTSTTQAGAIDAVMKTSSFRIDFVQPSNVIVVIFLSGGVFWWQCFDTKHGIKDTILNLRIFRHN